MLVDLLKTEYHAKINEINGKIPSMTGLATTPALNAVDNKILEFSNLVKKKKTDNDAKISNISRNILLQLIIINL